MSVSIAPGVSILLARPSSVSDRRYPVGQWISNGYAIGDLSGGQVICDPTTGAAISKKFVWSWEFAEVHSTLTMLAAPTGMMCRFNTAERVINAQDSNYKVFFRLMNIWNMAGVAWAANEIAQGGILPLFWPTARPDSAVSFQVRVDENQNGHEYTFNLGGYVWERNVYERGGPVRP